MSPSELLSVLLRQTEPIPAHMIRRDSGAGHAELYAGLVHLESAGLAQVVIERGMPPMWRAVGFA